MGYSKKNSWHFEAESMSWFMDFIGKFWICACVKDLNKYHVWSANAHWVHHSFLMLDFDCTFVVESFEKILMKRFSQIIHLQYCWYGILYLETHLRCQTVMRIYPDIVTLENIVTGKTDQIIGFQACQATKLQNYTVSIGHCPITALVGKILTDTST